MIHRVFAFLKRFLPDSITRPIRSIVTALLTPARFSVRSGHLRSCFKMAAVSRGGEPLPWYTYPMIDFLNARSFDGANVLEFGGGQSSVWWARQAERVVTFEGDDPRFSPRHEWYEKIAKMMPANVDLHEVSMESEDICTAQVREVLDKTPIAKFDVIIIDGLYRRRMVDIAIERLDEAGIIIVDNAEGYGIYEAFLDSGMMKVEFYGYVPGVYLKSCTALYFRQNTSCVGAKIEYLVGPRIEDS